MEDAMDLETSEVRSDDRDHQHIALTWPLVLTAGWLIYEVTAQPNLGAVFVCAKFGWNDFRTAFWLRRHDSDSGRGWACFWFYLSSALWKIAITAVLVILLVAFLSAGPQQPQPRPALVPPHFPAWLPGVALTACIGFGLSTFTTAIALALAVRYQVKFWLTGQTHRFRRRNSWPPYNLYRFPDNQANRVFVTALIILIFLLLALLFVGLVAARMALDPAAAIFVIVTAVSSGAVLVLIGRDVLQEHFVARVPWECWSGDRGES
jgi:hypothetical protein